jgi:hypothetical protein
MGKEREMPDTGCPETYIPKIIPKYDEGSRLKCQYKRMDFRIRWMPVCEKLCCRGPTHSVHSVSF